MPKTEYSLGESLDITDAKIKVVYKDNTEKLVDITSSMLSGFDSNTLGEQYIKVYYENQSTVFTVTVTRAIVTGVELVIPEENVNYIEGQLLRTNGTYMQISFLDGTIERIDVTREMCSGYDANKLGSQIVNVVGYLDGVEYTSSFVVTVVERQLTGIEVTTVPTKQIYYVGDSALDLAGGVMFLKYDSGYSEYVDMSDVNGEPIEGLEVSWNNTVVNDKSIVTLTYGFKTATFQVQVKVRDVSSYEIDTTTVKDQKQNLDLNLDGMGITINYNNGESEKVTLPSDKVSFSGFDSSKTGTQEVTIVFSYGGVELATKGSLNLNVEPRKADHLEMVTAPTIYQDTEFDVTAFELRIVYDNGEVGETFNLNNAMIAWANDIPRTSYADEGEQNWVISYPTVEKNLVYVFDVEGLEVVDIQVHEADNVIAYLGGQVKTDGVYMTVTYNSGLVVENVALTPDMVFGYDAQKAGYHRANIHYTDKYEEGFDEAVIYLTIVREVTDVVIKGEYRTIYVVGQTFSPAGMELEVSYKNEGSTTTIEVPVDTKDDFYDEWTFYSGAEDRSLTFTEVGQQIIYLSNVGLDGVKSIIVTVQNNVTKVGPLYREIDGVLRQVSGFEGDEAHRNVGFGEVVEGKEIDLTGYFVFVDFESSDAYDKYVPVTKEMIDYNPKYTKAGERNVTIYYPDIINCTGDESTTYKTIVTVMKKSIVGVKLLATPDKTIYYQDANNYNGISTDYDGMMLSIEYDNGTYGPIDIQEAISMSRLNIGNIDVREKGTKEVTFSYRTLEDELYEGSFEVEVVDSTPIAISWAQDTIPYVELSLGSTFNVIGIGYIDGSNMIKPLDELMLSVLYSGSSSAIRIELGQFYEDGMLKVEGYNANQTGEQDVRLVHVNDSNLFVTVKTKVVERTLREIKLVRNGILVGEDEKIVVIEGKPLDLATLSIQLVFSDDVVTIIPMEASYIYLSENNPGGYDLNDATLDEGNGREVTISYVYGNETTPVTTVVLFSVIGRSLEKIEVNAIPRQFYVEHEEFDVSQGSIMLYYDNGDIEELFLSEASTTNSSAPFYIDKSRFDNSEFTGYSKVQPIKIRHGNCTTSYNVYMRDRRNVEVVFDDNNKYVYTYGEIGVEGNSVNPIALSMMGYEAYSESEREKAITNYTIEFIPKAIWTTQKRVDGVDYTVVPKEVGEYVIVVSYNVDIENVADGIHNAYEDSSKTLIINKKTIQITFLEQSKIYGTGTPMVYLVFADGNGNPSVDPLNELFVVGDGLRTPSFNPDYENYYNSLVYLWGGVDENGEPKPVVDDVYGTPLLIDVFNVVYKDKSTGAVLEITDTTDVGIYNLTIENQFISPNYNVIYKDVDFTINKRQVVIVPESISYSYGTEVAPTILYSTKKATDENGNTISDSGVYGTDMLLGSPRKNSSENVVGVYGIDVGSLSSNNPNYSFSIEEGNTATVTIYPRSIYVKTNSLIKVYGEPFVEPQVKFFSDAACTKEEGAFASGDSIASLGQIVYPSDVEGVVMDATTKVGNYKYSCTIDTTNVSSSENYKIVYVDGYVEVVKRPVNVIATAKTKVYGEDDPTLTYIITPVENETASGIVNNDAFEGKLTRVSGNNYGEYAIQLGTLSNNNYEIRFTSATFSILRKELYVYVAEKDLIKVYDGKVPSINSYELYETREEGAVKYEEEGVRQFIEFSFKGENKGFGLYEVGVQVNSNNYSIALFDENGYSYEIQKRKVAITRNEYFNLPDGLEYKGSAYEFYAQINPADIQHVYNNDGSYATDDNNKPLFDDPSVTLSIQSVTNQGTYIVSVVEIADKNYELDLENSKPIEFEILPRTIKVVLKTNAGNNTIEREFNNQSAYISAADYTLENLISEDDIPYFGIGIYSLDGKETTATDVYYDVENGGIIGYSIKISEKSTNPNYNVVLARDDYQYKIVPKDVIIRIYDKYRTKSYDGVEPSIKTSMFAPVNAVTGFDTNSVMFEFIREENDGKDNASVGRYSIVVTCMDRNFNVTTQDPNYVYEITKANVSVSINGQSMEKAYDGYNFSFDIEDLTFTAYYGNSLIVHNFAHAMGEEDEYQDFVDKLRAIENAINTLDAQIGVINFAELSFAKNNLNLAILKANELMDLLNATTNPMQSDNTTEIKSVLETIISNFRDAITNIDNGEVETATGFYRSVTTTLMPMVKKAFDRENSYVAFIFGTEVDNTSSAVGTHPFTVKFSDSNRNFTLLNPNRVVSVSKHTIYVNVPDLNITYGNTVGTIPFELYDPRTGENVTTTGNFQVQNAPVAIGDCINVGRYDIDISEIYLSENGLEESDNYILLPGTVGQIVVNKAILTIKIDDVEDPSTLAYGKTVESSIFTGRYSYLQGSTIPEYSTDKYIMALIEEAYAWAEANGYGNEAHDNKMAMYCGSLKHEDEFEKVIKTNAVRYNCYLNGESGTQIFDVPLFDAGEYKLSATGFKSDNYEIKVVPGVLTIAKRELNLYVQNGEYYEKEYGENKVDLIYTNFAGEESANSVMVYFDSDGDGVADGEVSSLKDMVWEYDVNVGAIDPLDPLTPVSNEWRSFSPKMGSYLLKNYTINFGLINVVVTKAPLYCTVAPVDGLCVSSIYMAQPDEDSYVFTYSGFKNGETAEQLNLNNKKPTVNFMSEDSYFDAGVHVLGQSHLNTSGISLANYDIKVEEFQYEVIKRKVQVWLNDVTPSLSTGYGEFNITPYMADVTFVNNQGVTSATIVSGQYGYTNFEFNVVLDDVTNETLKTKIIDAFGGVTITKRTKADSVFNEQETQNGSTYTEIYRYNDMYKHTLVGSVDHEHNTANLRLSNMSMNSGNFTFEYVPFTAEVYSSITNVVAYMEQKLVENDLALSKSQIRELITFTVFKSSNTWTTLTVDEMVTNGWLQEEGSIPTATSHNALMKYTLIDSAYNYQLKTTLTNEYYTNYNSGVANATAVSVVDSRVEKYDYSQVASCTLPLRFYPSTTAVVYNPTLSNGVEYKKQNVATSLVKITAQETLFNAMALEFSIRPNANVKAPKLEIGLNADIDNSVISLVFNYGVPNVVTLKINNGGKTALATYSLSYGNLFDGNMHEIRAYLDEENLYLFISVDGNSGEMLSLAGIKSEQNEEVLTSPEDILERSTLSLTLGGDYIIRKITLSEQGLYDGVGAHIAIPANSSNVVKVSTLLDNFEASVSNLNTMFGLMRLDESYLVSFFVDGKAVEYNDSIETSIKLKSGIHLVELALYKDNVLVDYDYLYLSIVRETVIGYVDTLNSQNANIIVPGTQLPLYAVSNDYVAGENEDASLVSAGIVSQFGYIISGSREHSDNYPYSYFNMSFVLEPSATYDAVNGTKYLAGSYTTTIELFNNKEGAITLAEARSQGDTTYQGVALQIIRKQASDVTFGTENTAYTYTLLLNYYINGKDGSLEVSSGTTNSAYEVIVYKDRNTSYYGNNGIIISIRNLYDTTQSVYEFNSGELNADEARIYPHVYGLGDRMTVYNASFEEEVSTRRDYLVNGSYASSEDIITLQKDESLTLTNNVGSALYSIYDNLVFNFNVDENYVAKVGDVIKIMVAGSKLDNTGNEVELVYDLISNSLTFVFYYNGIPSLAQVWQLEGTVSGSHKLQVVLDKELVEAKANTYVGSDSGVDNLYYGDQILTATNKALVHYTSVKVVMDGAETTFYMPLYNDMGCWLMSNGYPNGSENMYSDVLGLTQTPTFLPLYSYSSIVASVSDVVTVEGYMVAKGENNTYTERAIKENPII